MPQMSNMTGASTFANDNFAGENISKSGLL